MRNWIMNCGRIGGLSLMGALALSCRTPGQTTHSLKNDETLPIPAAWDEVDSVTVDVGNTTAMQAKIDAIARATRSIELMYFLYGHDFAGSRVAEMLVEKARAGVRVRMIVDAKTTLAEQGFFSSLVTLGQGNLQVAYFRPFPPDVIADLKILGFEDFAAFAGVIATGDFSQASKLLEGNTLLRDNTEARELLLRFLAMTVMAGGVAADAPADVVEDLTGSLNSGGSSGGSSPAVERLGAALREQFPGARFSGRSWFDLSKWNHHKLLLVDGEYLQGGGRNLEDAYHWEKDDALRRSQNITKYVFMDADYFVSDPGIAARAQVTFNDYWRCTGAADCRAKIPLTLAEPAPTEKAEQIWQEIRRKAEMFKETRQQTGSYKPIHVGRITARKAKVGYAENRMFPGPGTGLLREEPSQHARELVRLMDGTPSGEEIVLQNAYFFLPASIQSALMRAVSRGVRLTIQTNSPASSDLGYIAKGARLQYRHLLKMGQPGQVRIYEYVTEESLHTKVWIIGDYIAVGSVNSDPRCEWLDTGNSLIIGPSAEGPSMASQYREWLAGLRQELLQDRGRSRSPDQSALREVSAAEVEADLAKYRQALVDQATADGPGVAKVRVDLRNQVEDLTAASFADTAEGEKARKKVESIHIQY